MSYTSAASRIAHELYEMMSEEDVDLLRNEIRQLGKDGWNLRSITLRSEAIDFIAAAPSKRARLKKWQDPVLRRHLTFISYHLAKVGATVLDESEALSDGIGASWRDMTASAVSASIRIMRQMLWKWPFLGPAPFPEWNPEPKAPRSGGFTAITSTKGKSKITYH